MYFLLVITPLSSPFIERIKNLQMSVWLAFLLGLFIGGIVGMFVMCLCQVSSRNSEEEEKDNAIHFT